MNIRNISVEIEISLPTRISLQRLSRKCRNVVETRVNKFPRFLLTRYDGLAILLFRSGRVVVTGIRKTERIGEDVEKSKQVLRCIISHSRKKVTTYIEHKNLRIKTILGTSEHRITPRPAEKIYNTFPHSMVEYEPEIQTYVIIRQKHPKVTLTVFPSSGNINVFGKNELAMKAFLNHVLTKLCEE